jgi:hypothetical protein
MKNTIIIFSLLFFASCDYWGSYTFKMKNLTSGIVEIKFIDSTRSSTHIDTANHMDVLISKGEEKILRIIGAPLNTPAHNCLQMHGMMYFHKIVFDTYVDGKKVEKQVWQPDNWTYKKNSKWDATYSMNLTNELCK